jgi:tetratricopeptide (TPR) repeat protein
MKPLIFLLFVSVFSTLAAAQDCLSTAKEPEQQVPESVRLEYSRNLEIAARNYAAEPTADNLIWYARRKGYLGKYKDAIESLTIGIEKFPGDARMYRHRGHRYITIRCFDDAIRDLEQAAKLIKGKPDEVEPDGLPNAKNIPKSTLQSNIWYHLGLAYYLKGDFKRAQRAYEECTLVSRNADMLAATVYWHYMTLRRMGKKGNAANVLGRFDTNVAVIENDDYLKLLKLNKGEAKAEDLLATIGGEAKTLGSASLSYGIGNYFLYNGVKSRAAEVFRKIVAGDQWASFGYIAAEADLKRMSK